MTDDPTRSKLAMQVYQDALAPTARQVGSALEDAVKLALSPATLVIRSLNEAVQLAEENVRQRLRKWAVRDEQVKPPPPEIAGPALAALRFAGQDPALRELYLNLLARAMVDGEQVHPAFAEVLRQLSPVEAAVLESLRSFKESLPLVEVRAHEEEGAWSTLIKHINPLHANQAHDNPVGAECIDNFVRLGLLTIFPLNQLTSLEAYFKLEHSPLAIAALRAVEERGRKPHFHRYMAEITEFGRRFLRAIGEESPTSNPQSDGRESITRGG